MVVSGTVLILPNIYLQWSMLCVIVKISYLYNKVDAITNLQITNRDCKTEI